MKNIYIKISTAICLIGISNVLYAQSPSSSKNYVMTKQVFTEGVKTTTNLNGLAHGQYSANINYFDGLGRLEQEVAHRASASSKDIIIPHIYDQFGREEKAFLSYVSPSALGGFRSSAVNELTTYRNTPTDLGISDAGIHPYAKTVFEPTPLGRIVKQGAPGTAWQPNSSTTDFSDHVIKNKYGTNAAGEILLFRGDNGGNVLYKGYYFPGSLRKVTSYDEDNHQVIVYTDHQDQTIVKRNIVDGVNIDTYYIYDDFGRLSIVIQPEGMNKVREVTESSVVSSANCIIEGDNTVTFPYGDPNVLHQGTDFKESPGNIVYRTGANVTLSDGFAFSAADGGSFSIKNSDASATAIDISSITNKYAFQYQYDGRGRLVEKYVPGAGWTSLVYDKRNLLRFTQDAVQKLNNEWLFIKYDVFDREVEKGIYSSTVSRATMQTNLYANSSIPTGVTDADLVSKNIYDDYTQFTGAYSFSHPYISNYLESPQGLLTGSKQKTLGTSTWLTTVMYYDEKYRPIQQVIGNQKGGIDRVSSEFNFAGWLLRSKTEHNTVVENIVIEERFTYDHVGRQLNHYHNIDSQGEVLLTSNTYNNLGELIDKKLHSTNGGTTFEQSVDYRYNVRGWLTSINNADGTTNDMNNDTDDLWGMELGYNQVLSGVSGTGTYNGNISAVKWSDDNGSLGYGYTYDGINRLKTADHQVIGATNASAFDVNNLGYDFNGNIKSLTRYNKTGAMDVLTYNYGTGISQSNRLLAVSDAGDTGEGFKDGNTSGNDYDYDANGNMIQDLNKGITSIEYNHLNLPEKVIKTDGQYIKYLYNGSGVKLTQEVYNAGNVLQKRSDYIGGFIYEQEGVNAAELAIIQHAEGRIVPDASNWEYQYHIKDHLGNTRLTFTSAPKTIDFKLNYESSGSLPDDSALFDNVNNVISNNAMDHTDLGGSTYTKSQMLNGANGAIVGSVLTIPVGKGDQVSAEVYAKYLAATATSNPAASIAAAVIGAITGNTGSTNFEGAINGATVNSNGSLINALGNGVSSTEPKAFINLMFLPEEAGNSISSSHFSYNQVSSASNGTHAKLELNQAFEVPETGFVIVYLSNESSLLTEVYFDDLKVTVNESKVIQTADYYPFGLQMAGGFNRATAKENKFLYNGFEKQDALDWGVYDYQARYYDPTTGRFMQVDPAADLMRRHGTYNYAFNNPIRFIDPDGMMPEDISGDTSIKFSKINNPLRNWWEEGEGIWGEDSDDPNRMMMTGPGGNDPCPTGDCDDDKKQGEAQNGGTDPVTSNDGDVMAGAFALSGILLADDATVIGVVDDIAIPFILAGATIYVYGDAIADGLVGAYEWLSKGGERNIWPDQYGTPPSAGSIDWGQSDSGLADDISDSFGDPKRGPKSPNNLLKKWFRNKRPK